MEKSIQQTIQLLQQINCFLKKEIGVWWLILCVILTRLRDAQLAGKTFFLGVSGRVSVEDISIWISRQSKEDLLSLMWVGTSNSRKAEQGKKEKEERISISSRAGRPTFFCPWPLEPLVLRSSESGTYTSSSLVLRLYRLWLIHTTGFPGSPPCRWQIVGLLNLHNHMSQFL